MKRKRLLSAVLAGIFAVSMLGGCASAVPQGATETTQGGAQETDRTSGTVKLRVWAEESTYDALNKMIDSFKEEYKGQATFDITLEQNADSDTRDNVLGDVHNAADVFIFAVLCFYYSHIYHKIFHPCTNIYLIYIYSYFIEI